MANYTLTQTGKKQIKEGDSWIEYDVVGTTYDTDGSEADFSADFDVEVRDIVVVKPPLNGCTPVFTPGAANDPGTAKILLFTGATVQVANTTDISGAAYNMRIRANGY